MSTGTAVLAAGGKTATLHVPLAAPGPRWMPPAGRLIWAQTRQGDVAAMAARAAMYGPYLKRGKVFYPAGFHSYDTPAQGTPAGIDASFKNSVDVTISRGQFPHVDFKEQPGMSFADVAAGKDDATLTELFEDCARRAVPMLVDYHNEPVGDSQGGAADFGRALARIIARRDAAGVKGLVAVTGAIQVEPFDHTDKDSQQDPGPWLSAILGAGVDALNLHGYNHWSVGKPAAKWYTADQIFGYVLNVANKIDPAIPKCSGEFGVRTDPANPGRAAQWLRDTYSWFIAHGWIEACFYDADQNTNDGGTPWNLAYAGDGTDGTERWHAFADLAADARTWYALAV